MARRKTQACPTSQAGPDTQALSAFDPRIRRATPDPFIQAGKLTDYTPYLESAKAAALDGCVQAGITTDTAYLYKAAVDALNTALVILTRLNEKAA